MSYDKKLKSVEKYLANQGLHKEAGQVRKLIQFEKKSNILDDEGETGTIKNSSFFGGIKNLLGFGPESSSPESSSPESSTKPRVEYKPEMEKGLVQILPGRRRPPEPSGIVIKEPTPEEERGFARIERKGDSYKYVLTSSAGPIEIPKGEEVIFGRDKGVPPKGTFIPLPGASNKINGEHFSITIQDNGSALLKRLDHANPVNVNGDPVPEGKMKRINDFPARIILSHGEMHLILTKEKA